MSFFTNTSQVAMPAPKPLGVYSQKAATHQHGRPVPYVFGKVEVGVTFRNADRRWQDDAVSWVDSSNFAIQGGVKTETIQRKR